MISVLHRRRRKHCCQHQSRKFRSTKTFHIVQNGLNILTSNDLQESCIKPIGKKPDGTPFYTLPVIHDTSTSVYLSESFHIAEYLEKMYPTPSISSHGTKSLHHAFQTSFGEKLGFLLYFILLRIFTQAWNTA